MVERRPTIRATRLDTGSHAELWEGSMCIRLCPPGGNTEWAGDERAIEVLSMDGDPSLPANVATAQVRIRNLEGRIVEEPRVVLTLAHGIFGALDPDPAGPPWPRAEFFVWYMPPLGTQHPPGWKTAEWVCCHLETWRERAVRLEAELHAITEREIAEALTARFDRPARPVAVAGGLPEDFARYIATGAALPGASTDPLLTQVEEALVAAGKVYSVHRIVVELGRVLRRLGLVKTDAAPPVGGDVF